MKKKKLTKSRHRLYQEGGTQYFDADGNYIPYTMPDPNTYSVTNPSGQRSAEMDNIDTFFKGALNSPIYKKRLGLQGSIRNIDDESFYFHPDYGVIGYDQLEGIDPNWPHNPQIQNLGINLPFHSWDSDEKNIRNQTKVDETIANRLNVLNTMTTDYSSEYDNQVYNRVHYVLGAMNALAQKHNAFTADGKPDIEVLLPIVRENHPELSEAVKWAYTPRGYYGDYLGSHSNTAPMLNYEIGETYPEGTPIYKPNERVVSMQITPSQIQQLADEAGITYEEMEARTYAHEVSHSLGAVYRPGWSGYGNFIGRQEGEGAGRFTNLNYSLNPNEAALLRGLARQNYGVNISEEKPDTGKLADAHVAGDHYMRGAGEAKADMDAVRYDMYKHGIYDYREGDLDQETWDKYLDIYRNEDGELDLKKLPIDLQRTLERYQDRDFIFLNNNIAMENEISDDVGQPRMAKKGGLRKKYEEGGQSIEEEKKADYQGAIDWFGNYLKSGQYQELLKRTSDIAGYPDYMYGYRHPSWGEIDYSVSLIDPGARPGAFTMAADYEQKKFMENPAGNIFYRYTGDVGSHYDKSTGKISMGIPHKEVSYIPGVNMTHDSILAHELGHTDKNWITKDQDVKNYILSKNKLVQEGRIGYHDPSQPDLYHHDAAANETRADLIQLRYELEKAGIFKSTGKKFKEFKKKHLKKAKETDGVHQRLFKIYSDEDIINLMNNIAQVDPNNISDDISFNTMQAKKGGMRKKLTKYRSGCC